MPYGDHFWNISAISAKVKLGDVNSPWFWKNRNPPPAYLLVTRDAVDINDPNYIGSVLDLNLIINPENEYAYIQSGDQKIPCSAHAVGGNIDVTCPDSPAGKLIVMENSWNGWTAKRDNIGSPLLDSNWLSIDAPAGTHTYSFRYKPWDVWVGLGLTILGIAGCIYFGRKGRKNSEANLVED